MLGIIGIVLGLLGTIILSIRVTKILNELSMAVKFHDLNFQFEVARASGIPVPNIRIIGSDKRTEKAEKTGVKLLALGFSLQIAGGICNLVSRL